MKSEGAVRHKLKECLFRHRQRYLKALTQRTPENCKFNSVMVPEIGTPHHICRIGKKSVCDARFGGLQKALNCKFWEITRNKAQIKAEFHSLISSRLGVLAQMFPDVAALLWVLGESGIPDDFETDVSDEQPTTDGKGQDKSTRENHPLDD